MKVSRTLDVQKFFEYAGAIQSCGEHPLHGLTPEVLASVVAVVDAYVKEAETHEETEGFVLVQLADGSLGCSSKWSDSSGHG